MEFTVNLGEIMIFLLCLAGIVFLIYLTVLIKNVVKLVKDANALIDKNRPNIDLTMSTLPGIGANIESITTDVKQGVVTVTNTAERIENNLANSAVGVVDKTEMAIDYVQVIAQLVRSGLSFMENKKK